ncbi:type I methionyl aminopeptidase [Agromyces laixinhei]|uniref:type I methionyl aminopeptidase n=1 Tax=Agromyces laixinhei TaxID=2585717 RepID=UPI0012EEC763|nr:type I methionyl aminopeptidase [Agromyces laixinhei]
MFRRSIYKSPVELSSMVTAGEVTAAALAEARSMIVPGATPLELDAAAERVIRAAGGRPNFQLVPGYRHTLCVSVDDDVVHGIPGERPFRPGDIVSVDGGAEVDGWNGDSAFTVVLPDPERPEVVASRTELSRVTEQALWLGIATLARARHLNEVGAAMEEYLESEGDPSTGSGHRYGVLTDYVGHGIGRSMHEEPPVFNYRVDRRGPAVKPGLVVAIEPMIVGGSIDTFTRDDEWTVTTSDGSDAAHWEHSVAVHADGIWVLTAPDGGAAGLAPFGVRPTPIARSSRP